MKGNSMNNKLREKLAAYAHEAWSGWMRYMFKKCKFIGYLERGNVRIEMPTELYERWTYQMNTPYAELPEDMKLSDCDEADKMITIVRENAGQVSDGYHTFDDLYQHRHKLMMALATARGDSSFKTRLNDKGEAWDGWFILGINTEHGQITYHLPDRLWEFLPHIKEVESNSDYDNHTPEDVLLRLVMLCGDRLNVYRDGVGKPI